MSLISEQIQKLRDLADNPEIDMYGIKELNDVFKQAANTIETLSAKLASENMERSRTYYNNEDDLEDDLNDTMICASRKSKRSTNNLLDTYKLNGLIGVYNLGLKDMYEYLSKPCKE